MPRLWMSRCWKACAVLLLLRLLVPTQQQSTEISEEDFKLLRLRITVRNSQLNEAISCHHSFAQVELHNIHPTDALEIYSISAVPEETSWIDPNTKQRLYWGEHRVEHASEESEEQQSATFVRVEAKDTVPIIPDEDMPDFYRRQIHVSRLPEKTLRLGPDQVAIVPISFLPRFPTHHESYNTLSPDDAHHHRLLEPTASPPPVYQQADWDDWVGAAPPPVNQYHSSSFRSNLQAQSSGWSLDPTQYRVRTLLSIEGNRGILRIPMTATSYLQNDYGLPSVISFESTVPTVRETSAPSASPADCSTADVVDDHPNVRIVSRAHPEQWSLGTLAGKNMLEAASSSVTGDCFDVYVRHPYPVRESRYLLDHSKVLHGSREDIKITEVMVTMPDRATVQIKADPQVPRQVIRDWNGGPFSLQADGQPHYLVTVCTAAEGQAVPVDTTMALEVEKNSNQVSPLDLLKDYAGSLGYLRVKAGSDTLMVALERGEALSSPGPNVETEFFKAFQQEDLTTETEQQQREEEPGSHDLKSVPERIMEHIYLSSTTETEPASSMTFSVGLKNDGLEGVKVKRASIAIQNGPSNDGVTLEIFEMNDELANPIPPNSFVSDAISIRCSVDVDKLLDGTSRQKSVSIEGAVIIRAAIENEDDFFEVYRSALRNSSQPFHESFAVEIPLEVHVSAGRIGLFVQGTSHPFPSFWDTEDWDDEYRSVSSVFFPLTQFSSRVAIADKDREYLSELKSMDHHLRVLTALETAMSLESAEILDEFKSRVDGSSARKNSLCSRFEVSLASGSLLFDIPEEQDLGLIHLRYHFPSTTGLYSKGKTDQNGTADILPTLCYLGFTTNPDCGRHLIPLVIYPGQIDVSGSPFQSSVIAGLPDWNIPEDESESASWHRAVVGFESLVDWFRTAKTGSALRGVLASSTTSNSGAQADRDRDSILLGRYLYSLSRQSFDLENSKLRPVLLKVGAISADQVDTLPLYLTNHNPVPISLSIDVGEVEGMSITLGRDESPSDGNSPLDYLPSHFSKEPRIMGGRFHGHPINGLRQFLLRDDTANKFLSRFPFRDAISMSNLAVTRFPLLKKLYRTQSRGFFSASAEAESAGRNACNQTDHPVAYGKFGSNLRGRKLPGPIIVSIDGRTLRALSVCKERGVEHDGGESKDTEIFLPPGGVARFDITLRSPPSDVLDKDITQFLSTGLVLSTNHGEVIPIFVSFEALQGKLEVSHVPAILESNYRGDIIQVPVGLFRKMTSNVNKTFPSVYIPPKDEDFSMHSRILDMDSRVTSSSDEGVELFMRSSFSRDIRLRRIASCNPWFSVDISESRLDFDQDLGVGIGAVSSAVACDDGHGLRDRNDTSFPSFFRCALNWLTRRAELQPRGCGLLPMKEGSYNGRFVSSEQGGVDNAIDAIRRALMVSEYISMDTQAHEVLDMNKESRNGHQPVGSLKSGRRSGDGVVVPVILSAAADAWEAWKTIAGLGLRSISTTLRAIVEYNSTADEKPVATLGTATATSEDESHTLSVTIRNVTVESVLQVPVLCDIVKARQVLPRAIRGDDVTPSVLQFPSTHVGDVSSITIPLRNPTDVTVRVRLAVAPKQEESLDGSPELSMLDPAISEYLGGFQAPYVHSMILTSSLADGFNRQWWGPEGGYFHSDFHGDVIRSHQNVTIKTGSGAQFSLINPSVMFNTAFLVGCGARCGLRDEGNSKKTTPLVQGLVDLSPVSPIGASAGAGYFLVGHKRSSLAQENLLDQQKRSFSAGGSLMLEGDGPSAFAVPFSALDEVIIPPHGETEIGPILFRPPGRTAKMGCASFPDGKRPSFCRTQSFEAMVLLENSLSGVERVVVRGKAEWENLVFIDPLPVEGDDAFGDIELRNGRPTLVFSGTSDESGGYAGVVVKEVVLENAGDTAAKFSRVTLSGSDVVDGADNPCQEGEFSLMNCETEEKGSFQLLPGENLSIFIKHHPSCSKTQEMVILKVERARDGDTQPGGSVGESWASRSRGSFTKDSLELAIGYEMSSAEFVLCVPAEREDTANVRKESDARVADGISDPTGHVIVNTAKARAYKRPMSKARRVLLTTQVVFSYLVKIIVVTCWVSMLAKFVISRQRNSSKFQDFLKRAKMNDQSIGKSFRSQMGNTWSAAFRCLAKVDPSPADLQTLGREQTRQIVLLRYRMIGVPPPQCFSNAGQLNRERSPPGTTKSADGRAVQTNGNERMRTLGDSLFGKYVRRHNSELGAIPCLLGWRTAAARGIINSGSLDTSPLEFATKELLEDRSLHSMIVDKVRDYDRESDDNGGVESFHASSGDADTNEEIPSEEEVVETEIETTPPMSIQSPELPNALTSKRNAEAVVSGSQELLENEMRSSSSKEKSKPVESKKASERVSSVKGGREHRKLNGSQKSDDGRRPKAEKELKTSATTSMQKPKRKKVQATSESQPLPQVVNKTAKEIREPKLASPKDRQKTSTASQNKRTKGSVEGDREKKDTKNRSPQPTRVTGTKFDSPVITRSPAGSTVLRPPPGLSPPPGFDVALAPRIDASQDLPILPVTHGLPDLAAEPLLAPATLVDRKGPRQVERSHSTSSAVSGSNLPLSQPAVPVVGGQDLLPPTLPTSVSGESGFDVMAFLDGILNEGSTPTNDAEVATKQSDEVQPNPPPFSPNPWATSTYMDQSRAAAYGISIEEENNRASLPMDLPLLTPDDILSANAISEDEEKKTISFYADLLGE